MDLKSNVPPSSGKGLVDDVVATLRHDILAGKLAPGERLNVARLATTMGISHIPIREAVRWLEAEGLVITVPRVGAVVSEVRVEELHEIYELRRLIEIDTIRDAVPTYTVDDLQRIEDTLKLVLDAPTSGAAWAEHSEAHNAFHRAIFGSSLGPWRDRVLSQLWQSAERYRRQFVLAFGSWESAAAQHRAMAEAALRRDAEGLVQATLAHLRSTETAIVEGYHRVMAEQDGERRAVP